MRIERSRITKPNIPNRSHRSLERRGTLYSLWLFLVGIVRWLFFLALACAVLVGVSIAVFYAYRFVTTHEYFAIRTVEVRGNVMLDNDDIMGLTGLHYGQNSLAVNITNVESQLAASPWVEAVSVKRLLPDRFAVTLKERKASFWVLRDGKLHYTDVQGVLLAPVRADGFTSLPLLTIEPRGEFLLEHLKDVMALFEQARFPIDFSLVSWVRLSAGKGVELYLDDPGLLISVAPEDIRGNLDRLCLTLADLGRRGELQQALELRSADGNVWVRMKVKKK